MPTNNELQHICDRVTQAAGEFKQHAIKLAQLEQEVKAKQAELAGLQGKIDQAQGVAAQVEEVHAHLRAKQAELAELQATIARKQEQHGSIDMDLRTLMMRAKKLTEPAA